MLGKTKPLWCQSEQSFPNKSQESLMHPSPKADDLLHRLDSEHDAADISTTQVLHLPLDGVSQFKSDFQYFYV